VRTCKKCGSNDFVKHGKSTQCRICANARLRAWADRNPEKIKQYKLTDQKKNPDRDCIRAKKYYQNNKEKVNKRDAEYRKLNKEKIKKKKIEWILQNSDRHRIYAHNRRAKIRESGGKLSVGLADRLFILQKGKCACCGKKLGKNYHLDHIMPIDLGGENIDSNIQLLTTTCNIKKKNKHPVAYMQSKGYLL